MGVIISMNPSTQLTLPDGKVPPLLRNLVQQYPPKDLYYLTPSIIDFQTNQLYGPWARLAEKYDADKETVIKGLFGVNLRKAYTTWPTDRPIPKIAVMVKGVEREETYLPGITPHLVRLTDATGDMLASIQEAACKIYPMILDERTVVVLENVPIFHRSRFNKTFLVGLSCISDVFPEYQEDRTVTISSQGTQLWSSVLFSQDVPPTQTQPQPQPPEAELYHVDEKPELHVQSQSADYPGTSTTTSSSSTTTTTSSSSSNIIQTTTSSSSSAEEQSPIPTPDSIPLFRTIDWSDYRIRSRQRFLSVDDDYDEDDDDDDARQ